MSHTKKIKVISEWFTEEDFLKDCPDQTYVPTVLPAAKRIIVIGDVHGDYELAKKSFEIAGLISPDDDSLKWIANPPDTIVVQVGDQIDSCRPIKLSKYNCHTTKEKGDVGEDIKTIEFFNKMHQIASDSGGAVYSLLGNHELMNAAGKTDDDYIYVSYENYYNYRYEDGNKIYEGPPGRMESFKPGGPVAKILACQRASVLIIGSNMFLHAGLLPGLVRRLDYLNIDDQSKLKYLNAVVRKWLLNKVLEPEQKKDIEIILNNDKRNPTHHTISPFWTRVFGEIQTDEKIVSTKCKEIQDTLQIFKVGHIIVGHTPQLVHQDGINGTCNDDGNVSRVYRVDGGFSRGFKIWSHSNMVQVLEIVDDHKFNIISDPGSTDISEIPILDISDSYLKDTASIFAQDIVEPTPTDRQSNKKKTLSKTKLRERNSLY